MKNKFTGEIIVSIFLVALLILVVNPFHFFMPNMMQMTVLGLAVIVFGLFSSFILKERVGDEREEFHRSLAGRVGFFAGSSVLLLGIVVGVYKHSLDPWLVGALVTMVIAKIAARVYSDSHF